MYGYLVIYVVIVLFLLYVGQLKLPRKFSDSYFNLGEPNLILVSSSKINLCSHSTSHLYVYTVTSKKSNPVCIYIRRYGNSKPWLKQMHIIDMYVCRKLVHQLHYKVW